MFKLISNLKYSGSEMKTCYQKIWFKFENFNIEILCILEMDVHN